MDDKENCPSIRPGFAAEETLGIERGRKGGGTNLRKSLAWNSAFFTDEGVLDTTELSMLSGLKPKPVGKSVLCENAKQEFGSALYSKCHARSHTSDNSLSRLGSDKDFGITTPVANILEESSSKINSNSSLRPSANSQKRVANVSTTKQASKLQKLKNEHCPLVRAPNSFYQSTKGSQHVQNLLPASVLGNEGSKSASAGARKKYDGNGSLSSRLALPVNSKISLDTVMSKPASLCSLASSSVSQSQSTASHSKPSALRMPSPSLGFFVQGKPQTSSHTNGQKFIKPTASHEKQPDRKASIKTYATQGKNIQISGGKPPIAGSITNVRDAGTKITKDISIDNTCQSRELLYQNCEVKSYLELSSTKRKLPRNSSVKLCDRIASEISFDGTINTNEIVLSENTEKLEKKIMVNENIDKPEMVSSPEISSNGMLPTDIVKLGCCQGIINENSAKDGPLINTYSIGLPLSGSSTSHEPQCPEAPQEGHTCLTLNNVAMPAPTPDTVEVSSVGDTLLSDTLMSESADHWSSEKLYDTSNTNHYSTVDVCPSVKAELFRSIATLKEVNSMPSPTKDHPVDVSKQDLTAPKPHLNAMPFTDEWIAAAEAFGEDILKMKTGAVQNSPREKNLPEPSPWSPVKKNHGVGPFDCTKFVKDAPL